MVDWMEEVLHENERLRLIAGSEIRPIPMHQPSQLGDRPDINCLPEFWRPLVLKKSAFADEKDYFAAIRLLYELQKVVGDLITPFFKASLVACKIPGTMCECERESQLSRVKSAKSPQSAASTAEPDQKSKPPLTITTNLSELLVEMRSWDQSGLLLRLVLLISHLNQIAPPERFISWWEQPNALLLGESPLEVMRSGDYSSLANFLDRLLSGLVDKPGSNL